jgi:MoaA/NifB/PqqE/SkfB family radical SAM enzyme
MVGKPRVYDHGDFQSFWDPSTGLFIRGDKPDGTSPEWSPAGPELADIHITDYCPMTCSYCYRESNPAKSTHMSVEVFRDILKAMQRTVCQIAIGGGSPQHHPQFPEILQTAHDLGIVPSYTTNGLDLTEEILDATAQFCGAVAVSLHKPLNDPHTVKAMDKLIKAGVPTGVHVILMEENIDFWRSLLVLAERGIGMFTRDDLYSCIFLMHKPIGRASWNQHPTREQKINFMRALKNYKGKVDVGIDSCASSSFISSFPLEELPVESLGPCDSGCFSIFIDEHLMVSPCSFNKEDLYSLEDFTFEEIWKEKLQPYRDQVIQTCPACNSRKICRSCQVIPPINSCERKERTV